MIDRIFIDAKGTGAFAERYLSYTAEVLSSIDEISVVKIIERLQRAYEEESSIFIAGNGGSAATASHFMVDLAKGARCSDKRPFRALSLTDNTAYITAQANDFGYDSVFVSQLENHIRERDVVIGISASGNSRNLVELFKFARKHRATTIGMVAFSGGEMKQLSDLCLHVETLHGDYGPAEDAHSVAQHLITNYLQRWLKHEHSSTHLVEISGNG